MIRKIQKLREKLRKNEPSVGAWIQIPNTSIVEIFANECYDWIVIDLEHGAISIQQLPDLFRTIECGNSLPFARLSSNEPSEIKKVLDAGARGLIFPNIESKEQLEKIISNSKYPPAGSRGVGFSRANLFGKNFEQYKEEAQDPIIVAMIESKLAVENIDSITAIKELDAILIGPYDLSASIGKTAQFMDQEFITQLKKIEAAAKNFNLALGIHVIEPQPNELLKRIEEGFCFLPYSLDSYMLTKLASNPLNSRK